MTTGITIPATGYTAADHWREFTKQTDQARDQQQLAALGRRVVARSDPGDLPPATVDAARRAVDAERSAEQTLQAKTAEAQRQIAQMGLAAAEASYHLQLARGPALAALERATAEASSACAALGEARVAALRQALSEVETRRTQEDQRHRQITAAIDADEQRARAELQRLGVV